MSGRADGVMMMERAWLVEGWSWVDVDDGV